MNHVRRALLFMPGDSRKKIEKGAASGVDSVIMDLEDGVALNQKDAARREIAAALREADFGRTEKLVRVNPASSSFFADDLDAVLPAHPEGILLPKVDRQTPSRQSTPGFTPRRRPRAGRRTASP
ncbi:MAG: hypothetical protein IPK19_29645 [Chloroflexi bacterium]|nr:hypothetical protein [Chloroflexota bacterium]